MDLATFTSYWPTDWVIITAVMLLVALESFRAGTSKAATLGLTMPITLYLYQALQHAYVLSPFLDKITIPYGKAIVFTVLVIGVFFFVNRIVGSFDVGGGMTPAVLSAASAVILLLLVWAQATALHEIWKFGPSIETAFSDPFRFYWALAALGILAFARS